MSLAISAPMEAMSHACMTIFDGIMSSWPEDEAKDANPLPSVVMLAMMKAVEDPEWAAGWVSSIPPEIASAVREQGMLAEFNRQYDWALKRMQGKSNRNLFRKIR